MKLFPQECLAAADNERNPTERLLSHALHLGLHNVSRFKLKLEMTDELSEENACLLLCNSHPRAISPALSKRK